MTYRRDDLKRGVLAPEQIHDVDKEDVPELVSSGRGDVGLTVLVEMLAERGC